jgi:ribosome-associated protein
MLIVAPELKIPLREFVFTFSRSGGPGGQNVNKVNTKALLRWRVADSLALPEAVRRRLVSQQRRRITAEGELLVVSQRFRDAGRNAADCLEKLRQMIAEAACPPRPRKPTRPTKASVRRRIEDKRRKAMKKRGRRAGGNDD